MGVERLTLESAVAFFTEFFRGAHHIPSHRQRRGPDSNINGANNVRPWGDGFHVVHDASYATYDFDELTRLVFLAHDRCVRVAVEPCRQGLRICIWARQREGRLDERHPTLDDAVWTWRYAATPGAAERRARFNQLMLNPEFRPEGTTEAALAYWPDALIVQFLSFADNFHRALGEGMSFEEEEEAIVLNVMLTGWARDTLLRGAVDLSGESAAQKMERMVAFVAFSIEEAIGHAGSPPPDGLVEGVRVACDLPSLNEEGVEVPLEDSTISLELMLTGWAREAVLAAAGDLDGDGQGAKIERVCEAIACSVREAIAHTVELPLDAAVEGVEVVFDRPWLDDSDDDDDDEDDEDEDEDEDD